MIQRFADRENDVTYKTQFQGHFKGVCNRNLRKIVLNSVNISSILSLTLTQNERGGGR